MVFPSVTGCSNDPTVTAQRHGVLACGLCCATSCTLLVCNVTVGVTCRSYCFMVFPSVTGCRQLFVGSIITVFTSLICVPTNCITSRCLRIVIYVRVTVGRNLYIRSIITVFTSLICVPTNIYTIRSLRYMVYVCMTGSSNDPRALLQNLRCLAQRLSQATTGALTVSNVTLGGAVGCFCLMVYPCMLVLSNLCRNHVGGQVVIAVHRIALRRDFYLREVYCLLHSQSEFAQLTVVNHRLQEADYKTFLARDLAEVLLRYQIFLVLRLADNCTFALDKLKYISVKIQDQAKEINRLGGFHGNGKYHFFTGERFCFVCCNDNPIHICRQSGKCHQTNQKDSTQHQGYCLLHFLHLLIFNALYALNYKAIRP